MSTSNQWVRKASYGAVWHRCTRSGHPLCGAGIPRNPEYEAEPPDTRQTTAAYICVRCYRIERGLDEPRCLCDEHEPIMDRVAELEARIARLEKKGKAR